VLPEEPPGLVKRSLGAHRLSLLESRRGRSAAPPTTSPG